MPVALVLRLDEITAAKIDAMVDALPDRRTGTRYSAHLKLAVYDDHIDVNDLDAALVTVMATWKPLETILAGVGVFPLSTLWLAVVPTSDLLMIHATLHAALADYHCDPHYEVGAWLPHVAMATTEFLGDAVEAMACCWTGSIKGSLESLDLVRVETGEVISSRPLQD
jgi:hypothetical protein